MGKLSAGIVPVTPFQQNCTFLFDEEIRTGVVVDPGGDVATLLALITEHRLTIEALWLTHGHIDHVGGAMELKEALGVPLLGPHRADAELMAAVEEKAVQFDMVGQVRNCTPDRYLDEGETVGFAGHEFEVLHCPGHSPGHIVYLNDKERFAHVGDVLFRGSVGRTDLPGGDHEALIAAIETKLLPRGEDIAFICGHGPGSTFGDERRTNPFLTGNGR